MKVNIGKYPKKGERKIKVQIDYWDTWDLDHTLAYIIHPALVQLKNTKHGAGFVADEDVPERIRSTSAKPKENEWDTDEFWFDRFDYVLSEMIWAFEQHTKEDDESEFFDYSGVDESLPFNEQWKQVKVDREGLEAHQKRKKNGFRLFGVYYQDLWT